MVALVGAIMVACAYQIGDNPSNEPGAQDATTQDENGRAVAPGVVRERERTPSPTPLPRDSEGNVILPCNDILVPVDKEHRLPADCTPAELVALPAYAVNEPQYLTPQAADAFMVMAGEAEALGLEFYAASSYRSYWEQADIFASNVEQHGFEEASRRSAQAGHSEHQLGTTTDVVTPPTWSLSGFYGTPEAEWLANNAWRYGFIVSYPPDSEHITGYIYEPWHIRYVGPEVANAVHHSGLTLGEYLHAIWW